MERLTNPYLIIGAFLFLFGINLVTLDVLVISIKTKLENTTQTPLSQATVTATPNDLVNPAISTPTAPVVSPANQLTSAVTPIPQPNICPAACVSLINKSTASPSQKESSISIQTSGSTQVYTDWYTIPGSEFTFNKANYPGAKSFYFQTNLNTDSSDHPAYARLYDATDSIGITGSDVNSTSTTLAQVQSGQLNPFSGSLTIRVQIKGLNGNLVTIGNSRIVILY